MKSHCKRGHELTGANVVPTKLGRRCRLCRNQTQRERMKSQRALDRAWKLGHMTGTVPDDGPS